jgi:hypothetical protein
MEPCVGVDERVPALLVGDVGHDDGVGVRGERARLAFSTGQR